MAAGDSPQTTSSVAAMIGARMADMHSSRHGTEKDAASARDPGLLALVCIGGTNVGKTASARARRSLASARAAARGRRPQRNGMTTSMRGTKGCAGAMLRYKSAGCRALLSETEETMNKVKGSAHGHTRRPYARAHVRAAALGAALGAVLLLFLTTAASTNAGHHSHQLTPPGRVQRAAARLCCPFRCAGRHLCAAYTPKPRSFPARTSQSCQRAPRAPC